MNHFLIILIGTTMLYVYATSRLEGYIRAISVQGILLGLMVIGQWSDHHISEFVFLIVETLLFKAVIIPLLLLFLVRKSNVKREIEPYIPQFFSMLIATIFLAFGFVIAWWSEGVIGAREPMYFGISISIVTLSLILIMTRKKIITHILAYIMMENGIFLLTLSIAAKIPFVVNIGVFLDIFVGIYMFVFFFGRIQEAYAEDHVDVLQDLKD